MKLKYLFRAVCGAVLATAVLLGSWEGTVHAESLIVNTLADENDHSCADGDCSLRDAIEVAAPGDTITFAVTGTITLTIGQLTLGKDLTINGPGASELTIDGDHLFRVFKINSGVVVSMSGVTVANGRHLNDEGAMTGAGIHNDGTLTVNEFSLWQNGRLEYGAGGGIYNTGTLTVNRCSFLENHAADGGGLWNQGTAVVTDSTFMSNAVMSPSIPSGGGMFNTGNAVVNNSVFIGNTAYADYAPAEGAGISNAGTLTVSNSTFTKNSASSRKRARGGGIQNGGTLTITNSTLSGNHVYGEGANLSGAAILRNTIIANAELGWNCDGAMIDGGGNLRWPRSDPSCVGTYGNPKVQPLADNGGPTQTMALSDSSAAVGFGIPVNCPLTDQRGTPRPNPPTSNCDSGAYESEQRKTENVWEDDDRAVQYNGWQGLEFDNSLGTYRLSNTPGDTIKFKFDSRHIRWVTRRGPQMGKARVTIDGTDRGIVDLFSATEEPGFEVDFFVLPGAKHRLVIQVTGEKNRKASASYVALDAFKGIYPLTDDTALKVRYNTWRGKANAAAGEGSYRLSAKRGAAARLGFSGTRIDWITAKGPHYGKAVVYLDGINQGTYDLYAPVQEWQVPIEFSGLSDAEHIIEIRVPGKKNVASNGKGVVVDRFRQPIEQ